MMGGRHRKGHKTRKSRKLKGGAFVGFGNNPVGAGAAEWVPVSGAGAYSSVTGQTIPDPTTGEKASVLVGGKRRSRKGKSKKGGKRRGKKSARRSRKMRGGAVAGVNGGVANVAPVGAGFVGAIPGFPTGGGTYGAYGGYPVNVPGGNPHQVGADGVTKV
jgi:hypothetical protein